MCLSWDLLFTSCLLRPRDRALYLTTQLETLGDTFLGSGVVEGKYGRGNNIQAWPQPATVLDSVWLQLFPWSEQRMDPHQERNHTRLPQAAASPPSGPLAQRRQEALPSVQAKAHLTCCSKADPAPDSAPSGDAPHREQSRLVPWASLLRLP